MIITRAGAEGRRDGGRLHASGERSPRTFPRELEKSRSGSGGSRFGRGRNQGEPEVRHFVIQNAALVTTTRTEGARVVLTLPVARKRLRGGAGPGRARAGSRRFLAGIDSHPRDEGKRVFCVSRRAFLALALLPFSSVAVRDAHPIRERKRKRFAPKARSSGARLWRAVVDAKAFAGLSRRAEVGARMRTESFRHGGLRRRKLSINPAKRRVPKQPVASGVVGRFAAGFPSAMRTRQAKRRGGKDAAPARAGPSEGAARRANEVRAVRTVVGLLAALASAAENFCEVFGGVGRAGHAAVNDSAASESGTRTR